MPKNLIYCRGKCLWIGQIQFAVDSPQTCTVFTLFQSVLLAQSMFGTSGASAEGYLFLGHPRGCFTVVVMCPRSLGKNNDVRCSPLLMALKDRVTLVIYLAPVHDYQLHVRSK